MKKKTIEDIKKEKLIIRGKLRSNIIDIFKKFNITAVSSFLPPNSSSLGNLHKQTDEIIYITNGKGFVIIDNKKFPIKKGNYFYLKAGKKHKFRTKDTSIEFFCCLHPVMDSQKPDMMPIKDTKINKK